MTHEDREEHDSSDDGEGEQLSEREAKALVNANLAIPVNAAVVGPLVPDSGIAYADADEDAYVEQRADDDRTQ